jgi:D-psicose/D-tagatose/L-ribulose 3-epimerase
MKFGANVWIWVSPFTTEQIDLVKKVAEMGFDWIEFGIEGTDHVDYKKMGEAIKEHGLGISVCAAMGPDKDLTIDDPTINRNGIEYLKHCVDAVHTMGGNRVAGPVYASVGRVWQSETEQRLRELDRCANNLREVGSYAHDKGVTFGLEALNRFETSFINTTEQAIELVDLADNPGIRLMADTFHMNIEDKDLGASLEKMGSRLVHVHANENDRGIPGSGHVDWNGVAAALKKIEYDGALVIESFSAKVKEIARAAAVWRPLASSQDTLAREGLAFLRNLMA